MGKVGRVTGGALHLQNGRHGPSHELHSGVEGRHLQQGTRHALQRIHRHPPLPSPPCCPLFPLLSLLLFPLSFSLLAVLKLPPHSHQGKLWSSTVQFTAPSTHAHPRAPTHPRASSLTDLVRGVRGSRERHPGGAPAHRGVQGALLTWVTHPGDEARAFRHLGTP